jgi:hypothetical protein
MITSCYLGEIWFYLVDNTAKTAQLAVFSCTLLQRRGASNTPTTYHFSKYRLFKLITSRGILYQPAQLLLASITLFRDIY